MIYTSIENEKIKQLKKLEQKKYRDNSFLIEGKKIIEEAIKKNRVTELFVLENIKSAYNIKTNYINLKIAKHLSNLENSDYFFALCTKIEPNNIGNKVLLLDNIQDPGNVGTIIRSAVAFGIDTIILKNCCDVYNQKVIRASMGMIFNIDLIEAKDDELVKKLKKEKYRIIGTNVTKGTKKIEKNEKFVIIMGSEGQGVSEELLSLCDDLIFIPIKCESLNVAIATSIILYELDK